MFILKAQYKDNKIYTYKAKTKTDCMFKFDRKHLRRGFKFFMVELEDNKINVEALPRNYPYGVNNLE